MASILQNICNGFQNQNIISYFIVAHTQIHYMMLPKAFTFQGKAYILLI